MPDNATNHNKHQALPELKERAVRMAFEAVEQTGERSGAVSRIARQLGIGDQSLRNWVAQTEIDRGNRAPRRPSRAPVRPGPRVLEGAADRRPAVMEVLGELADARPFPEVGVDTLDVDHLDQPFLWRGCGVRHLARYWRVRGSTGSCFRRSFGPAAVRFMLPSAT